MKKTLVALLLTIILATPAFGKINVVATLPWIGSLAGTLGGNDVGVTVLVKPSQDPHQIEAKPSMILAARNADLLVYNGLDLEIGYLPLIIESSRNPRIQPGRPGNLDCSRFVAVIEKMETADRSMGDVHPLGNPHYHLSARNVLNVARGMAETLAALDPGQASSFRANLAAFEAKWGERQGKWAKTPLKGKRYVAYHRFFEYLALEHGFTITDYVEQKPGIPPSAGHIERLIEGMSRTKPDAILTTGYYGTQEVSALSRKTGVRSIVVPHDVGSARGTDDWFSLMDAVLKALE